MKRRRYAGGGSTEDKIAELQRILANPQVSDADKKNYTDILSKLQAKLKAQGKTEEKAEPKTPKKPTAKTTPKKPTAKTTPKKPTAKTTLVKPTAKTTLVKPKTPKKTKPAEKKVPKGLQLVSRKKVTIDGKEVSTDSKEFCDYLTAEFIKRKEQAKNRKTTRKKTKSVMAQVTDKIEQGVEKAIKTGISKQKPTLKNNPKVFIGKVEKLETATKNFLQQLKEVLGNDYDAKEVTETAKAINKLIADLKKKYAVKK